MQMGRLFEIVYILMERERVTAKELATHFEVSVRTIYRDVETLSASGIPVYMNKGKGGGIALLSNFVLDKSLITEEEKKIVLASLQALDTVGFEDQEAALTKLKTVFGGSNSNWIEVDFGFWSDGEKEAEIFKQLKTAIIGKKEISFQYTSAREAATDRTVEPLKLVFKGTSWYLYAYCKLREDYRFFKLKRITGVTVSDCGFARLAPEKILQNTPSPKHREKILIKLKISKEAAYRVYDDFMNFTVLDDGSFMIEDFIEDSEGLLYYLISYGQNLEVLAPIELKEKIQKNLKAALERY